jgi:hypothetical protein
MTGRARVDDLRVVARRANDRLAVQGEASGTGFAWAAGNTLYASSSNKRWNSVVQRALEVGLGRPLADCEIGWVEGTKELGWPAGSWRAGVVVTDQGFCAAPPPVPYVERSRSSRRVVDHPALAAARTEQAARGVEDRRIAALSCKCRPCCALALGKSSCGYTYQQLREVLASDLREGDTWVSPAFPAVWRTTTDGTVYGDGIAAYDPPAVVAWTITHLAADRTFTARRHDGAHDFTGRLPDPPATRPESMARPGGLKTVLRVEPRPRTWGRTWTDELTGNRGGGEPSDQLGLFAVELAGQGRAV